MGKLVVSLEISLRDDGGAIVTSPDVPGFRVSGANSKTVFEDLGTVLRRMLIVNEGIDWLKADHER